MDAKTRRRLLWVLERYTALSELDRFNFVSGVLQTTINSRNDLDAHDIRKSLTHIIHSCNTSTGNAKHYAAAAALLRYMARSEMDSQSNTSNTRRATTSATSSSSSSSSSIGATATGATFTTPEILFSLDDFRVHPKGQGIVCARLEGLAPYTFVSEYIGELYPPWRWFEKNDAVKKMQKTLKKASALPDFYNITLERHSDDNEGFNVMFVDPIARGNFASRLSHSCNPNCATVVVACDGRYTICVYTLRRIEYGQELTFDYNSVTEDKEEFKRAVCLCGSKTCRGSFLYYANSSTFQQVFSSKMTALVRTANILRASDNPTLTPADVLQLSKNGFGQALLPKNIAPDWLRKFVVLTLDFIELENKVLPVEIRRLHPFFYTDVSAALEADGVKANRIQNLAITVDKVLHVLRENGCTDVTPMRSLTDAEVIERLYTHKERSIVSKMMKNIDLYITGLIKNDTSSSNDAKKKKKNLKETYSKIKSLYVTVHISKKSNKNNKKQKTSASSSLSAKAGLIKVKKIMISIAKELTKSALNRDLMSDKQSRCLISAADTLVFYARTRTHFTSNTYGRVDSPPLELRECDIGKIYSKKCERRRERAAIRSLMEKPTLVVDLFFVYFCYF